MGKNQIINLYTIFHKIKKTHTAIIILLAKGEESRGFESRPLVE